MSKIQVMSVTGNPELLLFKTLAQTERTKTYEIQEMHESEYDQQVKLLKRNTSLRIQIKKLQPLCNSEPYSLDDSFASKTVKRPLLVIQNGTPTVHATRKMKFTQSLINEAYLSQLKFFNQKKSCYAQMVFQIEDQYYPVIIELFKEYAPKACENFIKFCQGVNIDGKYYTYKNTQFNKIKPNGFIQGGQFDKIVSLYGGYFEDESYALKHDTEGILGLVNHGFQHTNSSQFYITLAPLQFFNQKKVAFGKIVKGMKTILKVLKSYSQPKILIYDCGIYEPQKQISIKMERFTDDFACDLPENSITFNKYIELEQEKHNEAQGEFTQLVKFLVEQIKQINRYIYTFTSQKKAIQQLNDAFINQQPCQILYILDTKQTLIAKPDYQGKYIVAIRAIDGSDSCRASSFIIFKKQTTIFKQASLNDFKQNAEQLISVGYCIHGQTTQFVFGIGYNLTLFTLSDHEFRLQQKEIQIPKLESFYSSDIIKKDEFLSQIISKLPTKNKRYTNSVFTTLHRVIRLGGLAMFQEVSIFDSIVCSFIISRAWGWSFCDGTTTFNQIKIRDINQTTYLFIGQQKWVQKIENHFLSIA